MDGNNYTAAMDNAFEASGGGLKEYNEYTLAIPDLADLADGSVFFNLELQGLGGEQCSIFPPFDCSFPPYNGAHLIFSRLSFEVEGTIEVAEPGTLALFRIGLAGMGLARRRRKV